MAKTGPWPEAQPERAPLSSVIPMARSARRTVRCFHIGMAWRCHGPAQAARRVGTERALCCWPGARSPFDTGPPLGPCAAPAPRCLGAAQRWWGRWGFAALRSWLLGTEGESQKLLSTRLIPGVRRRSAPEPPARSRGAGGPGSAGECAPAGAGCTTRSHPAPARAWAGVGSR